MPCLPCQCWGSFLDWTLSNQCLHLYPHVFSNLKIVSVARKNQHLPWFSLANSDSQNFPELLSCPRDRPTKWIFLKAYSCAFQCWSRFAEWHRWTSLQWGDPWYPCPWIPRSLITTSRFVGQPRISFYRMSVTFPKASMSTQLLICCFVMSCSALRF